MPAKRSRVPPTDRKRIEVALVRWVDAAITGEQTCWPHELGGPLEQESAGVVVAEDDDSITITLDRCRRNGGMRGVLCVPKINVRYIRRWTVADR